MAIINFNSISGVSTISVASSITVGNNVSIGTDRVTATTFSGNLSGNVTGNVNSTGVTTVTTLNATSIVGVSTAGITTAYINTLSGISTISASSAVSINQNLVFASGKGIDFSATANSSGTMTSELLADYEEGTFTPTVFLGSTQQTVSTSTGTYTKIGNTVFFSCRLEGITKSGTGELSLRSLPFTPSSNGNENRYSQPTLRWASINPSGIIVPLINPGGGAIHILFQIFTTTGGYVGNVNDTHCSATYQLYGVSGFYTT